DDRSHHRADCLLSPPEVHLSGSQWWWQAFSQCFIKQAEKPATTGFRFSLVKDSMERVTINPIYLPDPAEPPQEAIAKQQLWAGLVGKNRCRPLPRTLAAVDVHLGNERAIAVAALVSYPDLEQIALVSADAPLAYPYIPGLLSWREVPAAAA